MKQLIKSLSTMFLVLSVSLFGVIPFAMAVTTSDVSSHNTAADCWQTINNNVYNLTNFISANPTNTMITTANCGTDITTAFNAGAHSTSMLNQLNQYLVGTIGTTGSTSSVLTNTTITPNTASIAMGATKELGVATMDQNNSPIASTLTFTSSNPAVATVDANGIVTGVSAGTTTITAKGTSIGGGTNVSGTSLITVTSATNIPVLTTVTLSPATPTIAVGGTSQLTASPKDQAGAAFTGATNTFSSSNTSVATVDNNGLITGVAPGTATITVSSVNGSQTVTGTSTVTVSSGNVTPILSSVGLTPATSTITNIGGTQTLTAKPIDQNGIAFTGATFSYVSSNPQVATVDPITGTITAVSNGTATITVTANMGSTSVTGTHTVTVNTSGTNNTTPTITSVSMPSGAKVGQLVTATINATDPQNGTLTYTVKWGDENTLLRSASVVPFVQTATFTHFYNSPGTYTATFTIKNAAGKTATSSLMITITSNGGGGNQTLTSVNVTPATASVAIGATTQLSAMAKDQSGANFNGATISYTSSNPQIATVSNSGLVTGIAAGTATITVKATSGSTNVSGTSSITVTTSTQNNNLAPVISGITAPTVLDIGQVGTWTVQASDPQNGNLSYMVDWGENSTMALRSATMNNFVQTTTFTHSYSNAGTYTVKFTVKNASDKTAVSTVTVNVGTTSQNNSSTLGSIALTANDYEVDVGGTQHMDVVFKDQNENSFDGNGVTTTFTSSNPSVATVDSNGLVTGVSQGEATITATSVLGNASVSDTALITVTPGYEGNSSMSSNNNNSTSADQNNNSDYTVKGYTSDNSQYGGSGNNGHHYGQLNHNSDSSNGNGNGNHSGDNGNSGHRGGHR